MIIYTRIEIVRNGVDYDSAGLRGQSEKRRKPT